MGKKNKKVKVRFCKDCEKQENLNNAPISDIKCGYCGGNFEMRKIKRKDVIVDADEIIKNFNRDSNSYLAYLNSWR